MTPAEEKALLRDVADLKVQVSTMRGQRTPRPRKTREEKIKERMKTIKEKLSKKHPSI